MNDVPDTEILPQSDATEWVLRLENYARQHPGRALLAVAGLGLATVLVARALVPSPPRSRAVVLLEDIQSRLTELKQTTLDRGTDVMADGAHAVKRGLARFGDLHLDRTLDSCRRGLKRMTH